MKLDTIEKIRIFVVEFFAICLVVLVSELLLDVFARNKMIDESVFLKTLYRAIRISFFIRLSLLGLNYFDQKRKKAHNKAQNNNKG